MEVDMTTLGMRALVSLGVTLSVSLAACAGAPARAALGGDAPAEAAAPLAIRFDNQEREHVHVYLVGEKREWLLGRVEPGATARLRIPDEALGETDELVQLAVLAGGRMTLGAARDGRARLSISQPVSRIASQRWRLVQGQLTPLWVSGRLVSADSR
jgi:hypothetical protein